MRTMLMKFLYHLAVAATLAALSSVVCILLAYIYWGWLRIPIGLEGGTVFITIIPVVFVLSFSCTFLMSWLLKRMGVTKVESQFLIALAGGALVCILMLAIFFPCEVEPNFVGGYFLKCIGWW